MGQGMPPSQNNLNQYPTTPVLVVDDQTDILDSIRLTLMSAGITNVLTLQDSRQVMPLLAKQEVGALVLDLTMPYLAGDVLLDQIASDYPEIPVIILTGTSETDTAVHCIRKGASDYIVKPVEPARFVSSVRQALEIREMKRELSSLGQLMLSKPLKQPERFAKIVTGNAAMHAIFQYIEMVAPTARPILINGETGVGKELVAECIHSLSERRGEFISVNAAGLDDNLFTDTLFGHEKGAFTGAEQKRPGLIERATGGTLFLDEIGDLEIASQIKLLRLLQESEYFPLGSDAPRRSDARIVVATHHDLLELQADGRFRKDLYYRLNTHHLHIPPLRDRMDDLGFLLEQMIKEAAAGLDKKVPSAPPELVTLLSTYHFPGNVRELQGMVFDAVAQHTGGTLSTRSFRQAISEGRQAGAGKDAAQAPSADGFGLSLSAAGPFPTLQESEELLIREAMKRAGGNQIIASEMLGLTRSALQRRLKRLSS